MATKTSKTSKKTKAPKAIKNEPTTLNLVHQCGGEVFYYTEGYEMFEILSNGMTGEYVYGENDEEGLWCQGCEDYVRCEQGFTRSTDHIPDLMEKGVLKLK